MDAAGRQGLGHRREQPEGHPDARGRRGDRVADRADETAHGVRAEGDGGGDRGAERRDDPHRLQHEPDDHGDHHEDEADRRSRQQSRQDEARHRHAHNRLRFGAVVLDAVDDLGDPGRHPRGERTAGRRAGRGILRPVSGREAQDVAAHRLGVRRRQVLELDVRVEARADDLELGQSDEPGEGGPREVHALHPVEGRAPVRAEQHTAAHLDLVARDAEGVEAPRHPEQGDQHDQPDDHGDDRLDGDAVLQHEVDRVLLVPPEALRQEERDEPVAQVRDQDADDDEERQPAAQQRRQRMQPVPFAVAHLGPHRGGRRRGHADVRRSGRLRVEVAHRPVRRVSATSMRVSRSASASFCGSPGIVTPVDAAAVTSFSWAMPSIRSSGPCVMSTSCSRP